MKENRKKKRKKEEKKVTTTFFLRSPCHETNKISGRETLPNNFIDEIIFIACSRKEGRRKEKKFII